MTVCLLSVDEREQLQLCRCAGTHIFTFLAKDRETRRSVFEPRETAVLQSVERSSEKQTEDGRVNERQPGVRMARR